MVKTEAFLYSWSILHGCTLQSSLQILYHCPLILQHSCKLLYVPDNILHGTKFFPSLLDILNLPYPISWCIILSLILHPYVMGSTCMIFNPCSYFNCTCQYWHHQYCSEVIYYMFSIALIIYLKNLTIFFFFLYKSSIHLSFSIHNFISINNQTYY